MRTFEIASEKFGAIYSEIKDRIESIVCEIEYTNQDGKLIGYWAYGSYDPELPYQGKP